MKQFFRKATWVILSPFVKLTQETDIFRTEIQGRVWYIPYPKRWMALWAKDFMKTHVRYEDVLNSGDVVIEVGACTGEYTVAAADIVGPSGHIYTFEIDPFAFKCLQQNIKNSKSPSTITAENRGVSDKDGKLLQLQHLPNSIASSTFHGPDEGKKQYTVQTVTLDTYFRNHKDENRVTLLKLTVNGHEPEIMAGARQLLKRLKYVTFQSARFDEAIALLKEYGYEVVKETLLYTNMKSVLLRNKSFPA